MVIKPIPNFNNYYAGEDGNIYSNFKKLRKLKPNVQTSGKYYYVCLQVNNKRITQRVHRLICKTFHGSPLSKKDTCSHLDGNWKNNKPKNLKWETYSSNHQRKKQHGTDDIGVKNSRSLIDLKTLKKIRYYLKNTNLTHKQIGSKFNVSRVFITKIANGYRYKGQGKS